MLRIALTALLALTPMMARAETATAEVHVMIRRAVMLATPGGKSNRTAADVTSSAQPRLAPRTTIVPCDNNTTTQCQLIVYDTN